MKILLIGSGNINTLISDMYGDLVVGVVDSKNKNIRDVPTVIIDFSHYSLLDKTISFALQYNIPAVIGTTGYDKEKMAQIKELSKTIPVLMCQNFSESMMFIKNFLSSNLNFFELYKKSIIERHSIDKKDNPSGTALMLSEVLKTNEITSFREPFFVAEHEIIFENDDEIITIKHKVLNRKIFAIGAVEAAKKIINKHSGLYAYEDIFYE